MITGLLFNNKTFKLDDMSSMENIDGIFRVEDDEKVITDNTGILSNWYDIDTNKIKPYNEKDRMILLPNNVSFNKKTHDMKFYAYPSIKEDIFKYFEEEWLPYIYSSIIEKYPNTVLGISMGLDSRYIYAILKSHGLPVNLVSWSGADEKILKYLDTVKLIDTSAIDKAKEYMDLHKDYSYYGWGFEYNVYIYYSALVDMKIDVVIEGFCRNQFFHRPSIPNSVDLTTMVTGSCSGRAAFAKTNQIKLFYPYTCRDIWYNFRRLNWTNTELTEKMYERIKVLCPELGFETNSIDVANWVDNGIKQEFLDFLKYKNHINDPSKRDAGNNISYKPLVINRF